MTDLQWKIEDGRIMIRTSVHGAVNPYPWLTASAETCASILQSAILATQEKCARAVDATAGDHDEDTPGGWCAANAARHAAACVRALKMETGHE